MRLSSGLSITRRGPIVETLNEGNAHPTSSTEVEENENRE
jgi:hypothetical protein